MPRLRLPQPPTTITQEYTRTQNAEIERAIEAVSNTSLDAAATDHTHDAADIVSGVLTLTSQGFGARTATLVTLGGAQAGFTLDTLEGVDGINSVMAEICLRFSASSRNGFLRFYRGSAAGDGYLTLGTGTTNQLSIVSGNISIDGASVLNFGSTTRQMINLWSNQYAIGVQSSTQYFRTGGGFAWYVGGVHDNVQNAPGSGGTALMLLDVNRLYLGVTSIDLGSTDTTIARVDAGKIAVEGKAVIKHATGYTSGELTASTFDPSGGADGDIWFKYT